MWFIIWLDKSTVIKGGSIGSPLNVTNFLLEFAVPIFLFFLFKDRFAIHMFQLATNVLCKSVLTQGSYRYNSGQTSLGQYCDIHIFLSFLGFLLKQPGAHPETEHSFRNFLAVLPPHLYKVETRKKFWIHASNIVCRVRGGVGPVWIGKRPMNAKVSQDFCPWL